MGRAWKSRRKNHRKPPRPLSWNCARGNCRLCGGQIIENGKVNGRKHWHQSCAERWVRANNPAEMRKFVLARDKLTCRSCDRPCQSESEMEADHVKPLFEAHGDMSYYEEENVVSLCLDCHKIKTKTDMDLWRRAYG